MQNCELSAVFGPEEIRRMQTAFDRSWRALSFAFSEAPSSAEADRVRQLLARRIVDLAQTGETDPVTLSNQALAQLPPYDAEQSARLARSRPARLGSFATRARATPLAAVSRDGRPLFLLRNHRV
jgi:hypothetical protein